MNLLALMDAYKSEASWAVWNVDSSGKVVDASFPLSVAASAAHGRAILVSLNPASLGSGSASEGMPDWANFHSANPKHNDAFLGEALFGTELWGAYMTDLHPNIRESDSRLVRTQHEEVALAVQSLVDQARLLGSVRRIVCVGKQSFDSVLRHRRLIHEQLSLPQNALIRIPHYSGANSGVHKRDAHRYRDLIRSAIGEI